MEGDSDKMTSIEICMLHCIQFAIHSHIWRSAFRVEVTMPGKRGKEWFPNLHQIRNSSSDGHDECRNTRKHSFWFCDVRWPRRPERLWGPPRLLSD